MTSSPSEQLWTIQDVATYLRLPVETLYAWRKKGYGPTAVRLGRHLRYDPETVRAFIRNQAA